MLSNADARKGDCPDGPNPLLGPSASMMTEIVHIFDTSSLTFALRAGFREGASQKLFACNADF